MGGILQVDTIQNNNATTLITQTNSTTLTFGVSGQNIVIPSGVTFNTASATLTLPSTINVTTINVTTVVLAAGAVGTPSLTTSGDTNTGIFFPAADTIAFTEGGTEAMRIDSSGNVGIGTTAPATKLHLVSGTNTQNRIETTDTGSVAVTQFKNAAGETHQIGSETSSGNAGFGGSSAYGLCIYAGGTTRNIGFGTNGAERMRIESGGDILIGKTASSLATAGVQMSSLGSLTLTRSGSEGINLNRLTSDGNLIRFFQDGTEEGQISVSGTTVTYSAFTGSHWSRFVGDSKPDVLRGTVLESLDQMIDWYHVEFETSHTEKDKDVNDIVKITTNKKPYALKANEQEGDIITYNFEGTDYQATIVKEKDVKHMMSKISDTSEAKNVYGVFHAWDNDDLINNDFYVASVGSYVVRIKAGQTVSKGDLLQSNGDGTAKVQADDLVRASSFAKVLSNTVIDTYEDGSFIVPCSLMC